MVGARAPASAPAFFGVALRLALRVNFWSCAPTALRLLGAALRSGAPRSAAFQYSVNECTQVPNCKYWSYHQAQEKCFLKDNRNSKSSIDYLSKGYISGTRKCPTPKVPSIQTESHIEIGFSKFTFLPSTFGKQFRPGDKVSTVQ